MPRTRGQYRKDLEKLIRMEKDYRDRREEELRKMEAINQRNRENDAELRMLLQKRAKMMEEGFQPRVFNAGHPERERMVVRMKGITPESADLILPEEVWTLILKLLSDPTDLWNCTNTCQLFETILRPWKTGYMFEQALPHMYHQIPRAKLIECRTVSRGWKKAVDELLEDHPSLHPYEDEDGTKDHRLMGHVCPSKQIGMFEVNTFSFNNKDEDMAKISFVDDHTFPLTLGYNPFIGRSVGIRLGKSFEEEDQDDKATDPWWDLLERFLQQFGKDIFYLSLALPANMNDEVKDKMQQFLISKLFQSTPNLRSITINFRFNNLEYDVNTEFPDLDHLESLNLVQLTSGNSNSSLVVLLSAYGFNVNKISIQMDNWNVIQQNGFPDLTELFLEVDTTGRISQKLKDLDPSFTPNLQKLHIGFPALPRKCYFDDLIVAINGFVGLNNFKSLCLGGNLERLVWASKEQLEAMKGEEGRNFSPTKLTTLELGMEWIVTKHKPHPNFNFIVPCFPMLETLIIYSMNNYWETLDCPGNEVDLLPKSTCADWARTYMRDSEDDVLDIHRLMFTGSMYDSKIWERLPNLKLLIIQWDKYTREEYDKYSKKEDKLKDE